MHLTEGTTHQIESDGTTVWVTGSSGECIGRFGRMGIDIHNEAAAQLAGKPQCLECTHGPVTLAEWERFRAAMVEHYGIEVPEKHRPRHFAERVASVQ